MRAAPQYRPRECKQCGETFLPKGGRDRYCLDCRKPAKKERRREREETVKLVAFVSEVYDGSSLRSTDAPSVHRLVSEIETCRSQIDGRREEREERLSKHQAVSAEQHQALEAEYAEDQAKDFHAIRACRSELRGLMADDPLPSDEERKFSAEVRKVGFTSPGAKSSGAKVLR